MGTWIEISPAVPAPYHTLCRSLRGNVDRNITMFPIIFVSVSRSLRGNVDRNLKKLMLLFSGSSRSLRGNVDRNVRKRRSRRYEIYRRSLRGNVDRNLLEEVELLICIMSFPTWERG